MSEQRDNYVSVQQRFHESLDDFCPLCGNEVYQGDPPIYAICQNPNCSECDSDFLEILERVDED